MGISKSIKNIFGKTKKKKDDVAIGGITTGGVATHSDAVKSPKTKPKNRNRVRLSKKISKSGNFTNRTFILSSN